MCVSLDLFATSSTFSSLSRVRLALLSIFLSLSLYIYLFYFTIIQTCEWYVIAPCYTVSHVIVCLPVCLLLKHTTTQLNAQHHYFASRSHGFWLLVIVSFLFGWSVGRSVGRFDWLRFTFTYNLPLIQSVHIHSYKYSLTRN